MEKTSWCWEVQLLSWNINNVAGRKKKQQATSYIGCILKTSIKACCQQQESNNYKCCSVGRLGDRAPLLENLQKPCQHRVTFMFLHFNFIIISIILGRCMCWQVNSGLPPGKALYLFKSLRVSLQFPDSEICWNVFQTYCSGWSL